MLSVQDVMSRSPIIPVISIKSAEEMLFLADALIEGGVDIFEITLRTPKALEAIEAVAKEFPHAMTGAGTVINSKTFGDAEDAGAKFAISPGLTLELVHHDRTIPLLPGVATASEIMCALEYGFDAFKLFPASIVGGVGALKAFRGPFNDVMFCPTGGINATNAREYLELPNVACIGGSWIVPSDLIHEKRFDEITRLTKEALRLLN
ncbi:MAG: 2-dehydro-3-deoxyphosphogluconate aldolase/(4S)-4-hydroxy-2-oxoglutarate aldolase [Sulfurimonas sp.]|jgi:2-dehydro-3-deoxyphosphogluconate aldolase/(4S)-4-hydroxy-2-oxoglutarate aldolase|uniref:bifunctional 4-hydroxy-2-oxoglutarate aldolase/2-dehydro-3-deoxy-phosphogluconate aldolase n=1 Tax=Sulfurimonas sp. TaxID=2022749 RepID=UPI0039E64E0E